MKIIRDGKEYTLTDKEVSMVLEEHERNCIRSEVEYVLKNIADDSISFETWESCPCADYDSESDAREDFIEYAVDSIYENADINWKSDTEPTTVVEEYLYDLAEEFGYLKED
jgi:hypothetical protein